jgi:hypothetical protein
MAQSMLEVGFILSCKEANINPLKTEFLLYNIYFTGNILSLRYKDKPVSAVRETVAVYSENHTKHNYTLWTESIVLVC